MTISISAFFLLTIALSTDIFLAGLSYSTGHVKVPLRSKLLISLTCGLMFTLSLLAGGRIAALLPQTALKLFSFTVLFLLALYKLYDTLPLHFPQVRNFTTNAISEKVNQKDVHILSCGEALLLSLLLSADSISAGLSTGIPPLKPAAVFFSVTAIHFGAITLGLAAGKHLTHKTSHNFAWFSVALLFLLAFLRLF